MRPALALALELKQQARRRAIFGASGGVDSTLSAFAPADRAGLARRGARSAPVAQGRRRGAAARRRAEEDLGMSYSDIARGLEVVFETCAVYEVGLVPREVDEFADALERAGVSVAAFRQLAELIHRARHKSSGAPTLWRRDTTRLSAWEFEGD